MIFFRVLAISWIITFASLAIADNHETKKDIVDAAKKVVEDISDDDEVPLNDPFAGNEAGNSSSNLPEGEEDNEMSLYNFKLTGLISGIDHSYISLTNSGGDVFTLTLGQYLGKIKFVDLRLTEAIFEKDDDSYIIIDFNNQIREANEY
tara:strand:+ start:731 stop:1177 length:447 start_codon:yes stop_codon:yes gene_type:complete